MNKLFLTLFGLAFLLFSCGDRSFSEDTVNLLNAENEVHDWLAFIEETDAALEATGERFESLVFTSDFEETKAVFWYQEDTLRIIRHQIRDLKTNIQSEISYYLDKTGLLLVQELIDVPAADDEMQTTEYLTVYQKEKPVRTWVNEWYGGFADPLQYKDTDLRNSDFSKTIDMYSLQGDFKVTFNDFLENEVDVYLLIETVGKTPYIAALKVERMDDFLSSLYSNKALYKKKPIEVDYQVINEQGWIFSYYRSGKFR